MLILRSKTSIGRRRPTQADVARQANVSQALVSYVLTGKANIAVPPETRKRVEEAASALGYVPHKMARGLRTSKTNTIALVIPDIMNPFYPAFGRGVQDAADARGYDVVMYNTDGVATKERRCLQSALEGGVDGVVIMPYRLEPDDFRPILQSGVSVLALGHWPTDVGGYPLDSVYVDSVAAGRAATSYLIERGHRRIGLIAGDQETPPGRERAQGYQEALAAHELPIDPDLIRTGALREDGGFEAMRELLATDPHPTAVFAANDLLAMGALIAIRDSGLRIPEDIAVVGFDDIPTARLVRPTLTTVAQFPSTFGKRAATRLFERLQGQAPPTGQSEELAYEIVIRASA